MGCGREQCAPYHRRDHGGFCRIVVEPGKGSGCFRFLKSVALITAHAKTGNRTGVPV
jgi:hypothetical protein